MRILSAQKDVSYDDNGEEKGWRQEEEGFLKALGTY